METEKAQLDIVKNVKCGKTPSRVVSLVVNGRNDVENLKITQLRHRLTDNVEMLWTVNGSSVKLGTCKQFWSRLDGKFHGLVL